MAGCGWTIPDGRFEANLAEKLHVDCYALVFFGRPGARFRTPGKLVGLLFVASLLKEKFMTKRIGRPPKVKKQEKFIGYFVTKTQYFVIQQKAAKAGVNISDYMRQVAITAQVKAKWTEEERVMVRQLVGISVELHGLVELAREEGTTHAALLFVKHRDVMDSIIKALCDDR